MNVLVYMVGTLVYTGGLRCVNLLNIIKERFGLIYLAKKTNINTVGQA